MTGIAAPIAMKAPALDRRLGWPDAARGIAMILVVAGHMIIGLQNSGLMAQDGAANVWLLLFYAAHMPIVFFVSGHVSRDTAKPPREFFGGLLRWIVLPYVIWSALLVSVQHLAPGANSPIPWSALLQIGWSPITLFWFLHTLFAIKLLHYGVSRLFGAATPFVALGVAVFAAAGVAAFGVEDPMARHVAIFLLFYETGAVAAARPALLASLDALPSARLAAIAGACGAVVAGVAAGYAAGAFGPLRPAYEFQNGVVVTGLLSIVGVLALLRAAQGSRVVGAARLVGVYSMAIYVQHVIVGAALRALAVKAGLRDPWLLTAGLTVAAIAAPILWQMAFDRLRLTAFFGIRPVTAPPTRRA